MRNIFLSIIFILGLFSSAVAETNIESPKSLRAEPETMNTISELISCGIVYFNLALHLKIAEDVIVMFDPEAGSRSITEAQQQVQDNWAELKDQLEAIRFDLYERNYNLQEVDYLISLSINQTTELISKTMGQLAEDPDAVRYGLTRMIEYTDKCDKQFLNGLN